MAKTNPNRQELLDFINEVTSELGIHSKKIEDLSSGVQYLHLLHQTHPHTVKMSKVNIKATLEYEFVSNLRLLASYLAQMKAPFTFDVQKLSQRNYQENLNLLKNLYKFHQHSLSHDNNPKEPISRKTSVSSDSKLDFKNEPEKKKQMPKVVIKAPQKPVNKPPQKKYDAQNSGFEGMIHEAKLHAEQIKSIMIVVKGEEQISDKQIAAQEKMTKIMKILGISPPYSSKKKSKQPQQREKMNSSLKCEPSKSSSNKSLDLESNAEKIERNQPKTQLKNQLEKIEEKSENPEGQKKSKKNFDCEEVKQNALKRYELRPLQSVQRNTRQGRMSNRNLLNFEDEDPKYNENLLSPQVDLNEQKRTNVSVRKSALIKREPLKNLSMERSQRHSLRKVRFEGQSSEKKQISSVKKNDEAQKVSSAVEPSDRKLRSSKEREQQNDQFDVIMD